jgi:hypothetical protein
VDDRFGKTVAVVGLILAVPGTLLACNQLGAIDLFPRFGTTPATPRPSPCGVTAPAEITLSASEAPRGGKITVHGSCFDPGERVSIRVHVTEVGSATADTKGSFNLVVTIPTSAPPPSFPTEISATGRTSVKTGTAPFTTAP